MKKIYLFILITFCASQVVYTQQYADSVIYAILGGPNNTYTNFNDILGAPDVNNDFWLSLGGGFVIVDMGVYIIDDIGADLRIYEGGSSYPFGAENEPFYLLGNENNTMTGWKYLGSCPGDICEIDFDSLAVNNIRYIAIFDETPEAATTDTIATPGADIDAIEALHFQTTSIEIPNQNSNPNEYNLLQNFPNPFNPSTTIEYLVSYQVDVKLTIYNSLGEFIITLVDEYKVGGKYSINWNGIDSKGERVTSGAYFYQLQLDDRIESKKMVLIK